MKKINLESLKDNKFAVLSTDEMRSLKGAGGAQCVEGGDGSIDHPYELPAVTVDQHNHVSQDPGC